MVVVGAGGHAKEVLEILRAQSSLRNLYFYDDFNKDRVSLHNFPIVSSIKELIEVFQVDNKFILGVGAPSLRKHFMETLASLNGRVDSVISSNAQVGAYGVKMGEGLNIMDQVYVSSDVVLGDGCLLNMGSSVHHDAEIGKFCEISPRAQILGGVKIGEFSRIGAGAIILPKLRLGKRVIVGAGAVVTKDISDDSVVIGIPARRVNSISKI